MRSIALLLACALTVPLCAGSASASGLGAVTAASVTTYSAASTVPTSSCTSNPTQDATIDANHKNTNSGTATTLAIAEGAKPQWALVQFTPCAPANAYVVSASMQLRVTQAPTGTPTWGAYLINGAWAEANVAWTTAPAVSTTASNAQPAGALGVTMTWSLTADVQAMVNGGANNGWAIEDNGAGTATGTLSSREGTVKPVLSLVYYP
jgi:hypothetical protein